MRSSQPYLESIYPDRVSASRFIVCKINLFMLSVRRSHAPCHPLNSSKLNPLPTYHLPNEQPFELLCRTFSLELPEIIRIQLHISCFYAPLRAAADSAVAAIPPFSTSPSRRLSALISSRAISASRSGCALCFRLI
jgi:hypothetical protein